MSLLSRKCLSLITTLLLIPLTTAGYESQTDKKIIRAVGVSGNYPILSKDVVKLIPLQHGTVFDESKINESEDIIKSFYEKNGFYGSAVNIVPKKVKKFDQLTDIHINIKRGKTYRFGEISVHGNEVFSDGRIANNIRHWGHFKLNRLKKDVRKIKKLYANKAYIKARVKIDQLSFNDSGKVDIVVTIDENKRFKIKFSGKTFISHGRLRRVTQLKERRSYDRYAILNAGKRLKRFYLKNGFPFVEITHEIQKPRPNEVVAVFHIEAGKRAQIKKVIFDGNKQVSKKKLKKAIKTKESGLFTRIFYKKNLLEDDRFELVQVYTDKGFFDANVQEPKVETNQFQDQYTITYSINEGTVYKISQIILKSDKPVPEEKIRKAINIKTDRPFDEEDVVKAKNKISEILQDEGYAYSSVNTAKEIAGDSHSVDIIFSIERGNKVFVADVLIEGNFITNEKTIRKNLKIKAGDVFNYQKMLNGQLNLRKLGVFSSVNITPQGFETRQDNITLLVNLIERKTIAFEIEGGFDSRYLVTGEASFTKYNLFGTAKQFNTRVIGGPKYDRAEATFFSPRIFGASWNLSNQYFGQYEDEPNFDDYSYGGFVNTLKNFGPHWTFGFKEQITHTEVIESKSNVAELGDSLFDNTFNEFQTTLLLEHRDNFSDPQKGAYFLTRNEVNTDLADINNNFDTFEFNASHYLGFLKRFTLVNVIRYGHTFKLTSSPRIPVNKLFFIGGADTVRGFTEDGVDPSGGTVMMIYNAELHLRLTQSFKLAGFFDAGLLDNNINDLSLSQIRESAGFGMRYFTPLGPIRLDLGFILDKQPGEPDTRLHFSFGYFF